MIEYFLIGFIVITLLLFAYIRLTYPFWSMQPVYHPYDVFRSWTNYPSIIWSGHPMRTKYTDVSKIKTIAYMDADPDQKRDLVDLLQTQLIDSDRVICTIDQDTIHTYLTGHNHPAYISFFVKEHYDVSGKALGQTLRPESIIAIKKPVSTMTSRPIRFFITTTPNANPDQTIVEWTVYYWDHICAHREHRKGHETRFTIQTHEYVQRSKNPDIPVSLFKKEETLCEGIIPLTQYTTYTFLLRNIGVPPLAKHCTVVRVFKENKAILSDFLFGLLHPKYAIAGKAANPFTICAFPEIGAVNALIEANLLYVYALKREDHILALYFLKDGKAVYEDVDGGGPLLECVSSVCNMKQGAGLFFSGFLHAIRAILHGQKKEDRYKILAFTDLGHNDQLLEKWRWKYTPIFTNPSAYYLFNGLVPGMPIPRQRCFIVV